ncbi:MAG: glycosyl hydrolase 53 family protein [Crocinitomicaceae bacterium]
MKNKMTFLQTVLFALSITLFFSCNKGNSQTPTPTPTPTPPDYSYFSKGADIGWLAQMEATGYIFYDENGVASDCLQLLKDRGMNSVRLRVWVNPSNSPTSGHCSKDETVAMAVRAKNLGMRVMINFHYSDSWADPGQQNKPAAWASHNLTQLKTDVYDHTFEVLTALKTAGVTPEWVQIGNEIPGGMLWPEGSTSGDNFVNLAQLLNAGYDATKAVDASIKVIVHIDKGHDNGRFRWFYDGISAQGAKFDVIGASYYPYWINQDYTQSIAALETNLNDMVTRYDKEVMVVEIGGDFTLVDNTKAMLTAVIDIVKNIPNKKGLGVHYWEPEGEKSWSGYQLNCWQSNGKPSLALDAFK